MLRCGVVLDSLKPSAWVARIVNEIQSEGLAEIVLVLLDQAAAEGERGSWLFRKYEQWDYRRSRAEQDALAPTDVSRALSAVPTLLLARSGNLGERATAEVRAANLDVVLDLGRRALYRKLDGPVSGVWRVRHDLDFYGSDGDINGWEALERGAATESVVEVHHTENVAAEVISRSFASVEKPSLYATRNPVYWKGVEMLLRSLRKMGMPGAEVAQELDMPVPRCRRPTGWETALYLMRYAGRWARHRAQGVRRPYKWHIAIRKRSDSRRFDDPEGYRIMASPEDRFYADPFLFEKGGRTFLFFEDFRNDLQRAVISYCELDEEGRPGEPVEVLRRPYHLSYPLVFEDCGTIYMVPETRGNGTVELYRASEFPFTWVSERPVLEGVSAVDATLYRADGRYWMFTGMSDGRYSTSDELNLFYADQLRGPWTAHPMNPLISDVRRARPAGWLFQDGGRLIRPSQDSAKAYGYALVFSEVVTLTETEYEERIVSRIDPESFAGAANHTYNRTERFEVVDRILPSE